MVNSSVWHYTCNAPENPVLTRNGIQTIGDQFNCQDPREVLLIPQSLYEQYGLPIKNDPIILSLQSETLLRRLSE